MGTLLQGATNATNLLGLKKDERVLIIAEQGNLVVGKSLKKACLRKTKEIDFFVMEEFGKRPLKKVPKKVFKSLKHSKCIFFIASPSRKGRINERFTFRVPLTKLAVKRKARLAAMIGVDVECMKQGMCSDYEKIRKFSKKLFKILSKAKTITVMSIGGAFLQAKFSKDLNWLIADGKIKAGKWSNLPDGEVWTCPQSVSGVAVINGSLGDLFSKKYGSLEKTPVYWFIKDSRVKKVLCPKNKKLEKEFKRFLKLDKNSNRIGEFSLGTNFGVKRIIGNLLQDEKIVGVHVAVGNPYPSLTGAAWYSGVHCDGVMTNTTVFVDGKKVMENGKYSF